MKISLVPILSFSIAFYEMSDILALYIGIVSYRQTESFTETNSPQSLRVTSLVFKWKGVKGYVVLFHYRCIGKLLVKEATFSIWDWLIGKNRFLGKQESVVNQVRYQSLWGFNLNRRFFLLKENKKNLHREWNNKYLDLTTFPMVPRSFFFAIQTWSSYIILTFKSATFFPSREFIDK